MTRLLRFRTAAARDPRIDALIAAVTEPVGGIGFCAQ